RVPRAPLGAAVVREGDRRGDARVRQAQRAHRRLSCAPSPDRARVRPVRRRGAMWREADGSRCGAAIRAACRPARGRVAGAIAALALALGLAGCGEHQGPGTIEGAALPPAVLEERAATQAETAERLAARSFSAVPARQ